MKKVREVPVKKRIALIAHDNKKDELLEWCKAHVSDLQKHKLISTGTTGKMLAKHLKMDVEQVLSGPLGGDQQIGARIADGEIDVVIFFWDPLQAQPHDSDVKALLRICNVWNTPLVSTEMAANYLFSSPLIHQKYTVHLHDYNDYLNRKIADVPENV